MDEIIEEDQRRNEKKAFYAGLATIIAIILIIALAIFFVQGCSNKSQIIEEAKKSETAAPQAPEPSVAGVETKPQATATPANKGQTYIVLSGDTLYEIGKKFKVDWHKIAEANGIDNSGALKVGKEIIIPKEWIFIKKEVSSLRCLRFLSCYFLVFG